MRADRPPITARLSSAVMALLLLVAACGGEAANCDELADQTLDLVQELIDEVQDIPLEEVVSDGGELPALDEFRSKGEALDQRADELGCSRDDLQRLVSEGADRLQVDTPVGELIVESIKRGGL